MSSRWAREKHDLAGHGPTLDAVGSNNLTVTPFFFAGLNGKFDLGGAREREVKMVSARY